MREIISAEALQRRVKELADEVQRRLPPDGPVLLIGVLNGAIPLMNDLMRRMDGRDIRFDVMKLASYGDGMDSSGQVNVLLKPAIAVTGRHVLLVDDICDTGLTLQKAVEVLREMRPAGIVTCTLLDKPSRRQAEIRPDVVGFHVDDIFVVGYGMGAGDRFRNLPFIAELNDDLT